MNRKNPLYAKTDFLLDDTWMISWGATTRTRRGSTIYNDTAAGSKKSTEKEKFKKNLTEWITDTLLPEYIDSTVCEKRHIENIVRLSEKGSNLDSVLGCNILANHNGECCFKDRENVGGEYDHCIGKHNFRIGSAQKLLNLQLKYLWCLGMIEQPPHCPIDSIILNVAGVTDKGWTNMNCVGCYQEMIDIMKREASKISPFLSLAGWELREYSENRIS